MSEFPVVAPVSEDNSPIRLKIEFNGGPHLFSWGIDVVPRTVEGKQELADSLGNIVRDTVLYHFGLLEEEKNAEV